MTSAGQIAVLQDLDGLGPLSMPAIHAPVREDLPSVLDGRCLLHFCNRDDAASISRQGLRAGSWCTTTPLSSYVADVWLGLPTRRNYLFVFDPEGVSRYQGPGISLPFPGDPRSVSAEPSSSTSPTVSRRRRSSTMGHWRNPDATWRLGEQARRVL